MALLNGIVFMAWMLSSTQCSNYSAPLKRLCCTRTTTMAHCNIIVSTVVLSGVMWWDIASLSKGQSWLALPLTKSMYDHKACLINSIVRSATHVLRGTLRYSHLSVTVLAQWFLFLRCPFSTIVHSVSFAGFQDQGGVVLLHSGRQMSVFLSISGIQTSYYSLDGQFLEVCPRQGRLFRVPFNNITTQLRSYRAPQMALSIRMSAHPPAAVSLGADPKCHTLHLVLFSPSCGSWYGVAATVSCLSAPFFCKCWSCL